MNDSYLELITIRLRAEETNRRAQLLGPRLDARRDRPEPRLCEPVTVRFAIADDARALIRLAELDSASCPAGPLLIGERAGEAVAALSLTDGAIVANPFVASADVVALLRLRARQLREEPRRRWRRRRPTVSPSWALRHGDL
ncbi:MAG TPA: hypothetical protein VNC12_02145 [Solirubrobacteraceae bacterium]|nr:hypothetical protein [Solirubrobacteraceae bacterium]